MHAPRGPWVHGPFHVRDPENAHGSIDLEQQHQPVKGLPALDDEGALSPGCADSVTSQAQSPLSLQFSEFQRQKSEANGQSPVARERKVTFRPGSHAFTAARGAGSRLRDLKKGGPVQPRRHIHGTAPNPPPTMAATPSQPQEMGSPPQKLRECTRMYSEPLPLRMATDATAQHVPDQAAPRELPRMRSDPMRPDASPHQQPRACPEPPGGSSSAATIVTVASLEGSAPGHDAHLRSSSEGSNQRRPWYRAKPAIEGFLRSTDAIDWLRELEHPRTRRAGGAVSSWRRSCSLSPPRVKAQANFKGRRSTLGIARSKNAQPDLPECQQLQAPQASEEMQFLGIGQTTGRHTVVACKPVVEPPLAAAGTAAAAVAAAVAATPTVP